MRLRASYHRKLLFVLCLLMQILQIIAHECKKDYFMCDLTNSCCPCDPSAAKTTLGCAILCPPTNECTSKPSPELQCGPGTQLALNEECIYPVECIDDYCCCACSPGTYNPKINGQCLDCANSTVSSIRATSCYDSCSYGTGFEGYGHSKYFNNGNIALPESYYRTSANGSECLNCIPGTFNSGNSLYCFNCPLPHYGTNSGVCYECEPLRLSYYSLVHFPSNRYLIYYRPCDAAGFGLEFEKIIPVALVIYFSLYAPSVMLLFQCSGSGVAAFMGMLTYIFLPISTNVLNLVYILFKYFKQIEIFSMILAFYLYPSLVSLLIILITYQATPCFFLCCCLPKSWWQTRSKSYKKSLNNRQMRGSNNSSSSNMNGSNNQARSSSSSSEESRVNNESGEVRSPEGRAETETETVTHVKQTADNDNDNEEDDRYDSFVNLVPVILLFIVHLPFYVLWLAVGYVLVLSKTFCIGSVSNFWFRVWTGSDRLRSPLTVDAELMNFLVSFQILFEFFPFVVFQIFGKQILVEEDGLNGLDTSRYSMDNVDWSKWIPGIYELVDFLDSIGMTDLDGMGFIIFFFGICCCISGLYRVLYFKMCKGVDLLDIPLSCKFCGMQLFRNIDSTFTTTGRRQLLRQRAPREYNSLPAAEREEKTMDSDDDDEEAADKTIMRKSFKQQLFVQLRSVLMFLLNVVVNACRCTVGLVRYLVAKINKSVNKKPKRSHQQSAQRNGSNTYFEDDDGGGDSDASDDYEGVELSRRLTRNLSQRTKFNKPKNKKLKKGRSGGAKSAADMRYEKDSGSSDDDHGDGDSTAVTAADRRYKASDTLLTSSSSNSSAATEAVPASVYKQDMDMMKSELELLRKEYMRMKQQKE